MRADQALIIEEIQTRDSCREEGATSEVTTSKEEAEEISSLIMVTQTNIIHLMSHNRLKTISPKSQSKKIFIM